MPNAIIDFDGTTFLLDLDNRFPQDAALLKVMHAGEAYRGRMPEPETVNVMKRVIKPGDHVLDLGACIGLFTCLMAKLVGPTGRVVAVEPDPRNLEKLRKNIEVNKFNNVEVIQAAVADGAGTTVFYPHAGDTGESTTIPRSDEKYEEPITVDIWKPAREAEFKIAKIDVEGAELRALDRLMWMWNAPEFIISEFNEGALAAHGTAQEQLLRMVSASGYSIWLPDLLGNLPRYVPASTKISTLIKMEGDKPLYKLNGVVLFATIIDVGKAWPEVSIIDPAYERDEKGTT